MIRAEVSGDFTSTYALAETAAFGLSLLLSHAGGDGLPRPASVGARVDPALQLGDGHEDRLAATADDVETRIGRRDLRQAVERNPIEIRG